MTKKRLKELEVRGKELRDEGHGEGAVILELVSALKSAAKRLERLEQDERLRRRQGAEEAAKALTDAVDRRLSFHNQLVNELSGFSVPKLREPWTGKPAQRQVLSNLVRVYAEQGVEVTFLERRRVMERMERRPLAELVGVIEQVVSAQREVA